MPAPSARLIRGHPPSPALSSDCDPASEVSQEPGGMYHSIYGSQGAYGGASNISFDKQSSHSTVKQPTYASTSDCSQAVSLQHPMVANSFQVNTPPHSDDSFISGSFESTAGWLSPSQRPIFNKPRGARTPRLRQRAKNKKEKGPRAPLQVPLSVLTKDLHHVPIKDMEKHVHRPISERLQEVAKKGKVGRPMNSFMLYRSAYQNRAKEWFAQNNHQVVSVAAGDSWNIESQEIKDKYDLLAKIEKENHLKAHPGYKFTPTKDKKKQQHAVPDDDRYSVLPEYRNTPEGSHASPFSTPEVGGNEWDSGHSTPFDMTDHGLPTAGYFGSSWPTSNPGRSLSGMVLSTEPSQYVLSSANPGLFRYNVEDIRLKKADLDELQYSSSTNLAGLPGAAHHDLLQPQTQMSTSESCPGGQLDPQLLEYPDASSNPDGGSQVYGASHYSMWQESPNSNCYLPVTTSLEPSPAPYSGASPFQPGVQTLVDGRDAWDASQGTSLDTAGGEFDHWINQHPSGY